MTEDSRSRPQVHHLGKPPDLIITPKIEAPVLVPVQRLEAQGLDVGQRPRRVRKSQKQSIIAAMKELKAAGIVPPPWPSYYSRIRDICGGWKVVPSSKPGDRAEKASVYGFGDRNIWDIYKELTESDEL
jgi:hypothetical protein